LLSRLHVIRIFTPRELTLALYASRDVLSRRPVSFIFFNNINSFGDLENLTVHPKKKTTTEQILWCGMLQRMLRDFSLLCISIRRCVPRLNYRQQSRGCDAVQPNFPVSASFPFYHESMSSNWVNGVTHRIEIISCQSQYVSYVKRDSTFQVAMDNR
ncbi:hypothetical protein CLF_112750, partial [Clonorchis sinensis]